MPFDSCDCFEVSHTDLGSVTGDNQLGKQNEGTECRGACTGVHLEYHLADLWVCNLQNMCLGVSSHGLL